MCMCRLDNPNTSSNGGTSLQRWRMTANTKSNRSKITQNAHTGSQSIPEVQEIQPSLEFAMSSTLKRCISNLEQNSNIDQVHCSEQNCISAIANSMARVQSNPDRTDAANTGNDDDGDIHLSCSDDDWRKLLLWNLRDNHLTRSPF